MGSLRRRTTGATGDITGIIATTGGGTITGIIGGGITTVTTIGGIITTVIITITDGSGLCWAFLAGAAQWQRAAAYPRPLYG